MSVVVAIKEKGVVYMAADTMVTVGDSKRHLKDDSSQKIWAVADTPNCIMGGAGYLRDINCVRYCTSEIIPEINLIKNNLTIGTIMMGTVPVIFDTIRQYNQIINGEKTEDIGMQSSFLIAYKGQCFHIMPDGLVEEIPDYEAIGSGADAALASLKHTQGESVYTRLYKALEAAADISLYVGEPYVCLNTEDTDLQEIYLDEDEDEDDEGVVDIQHDATEAVNNKNMDKNCSIEK